MRQKTTSHELNASPLVCGPGASKAITGEFPVALKPHPLKSEQFIAWFPQGSSIAEVLGDIEDDNLHVSIRGEYIPREQWERIRPKAGTTISVVRIPQGRTAKKIVGAVLLIVIAYFAPYLLNYMYAAYGMWGAAAAIGITLLATAAAYALIPPPEIPKIGGGDGFEFNRLNAITGTSNQATPYGIVPMVIGECRYYPTLAANPYTEILGDQHYLRMLFDMGYGDLEISDIKIGETPIESFDGVDYEIAYSPDLFTDDVFELALADGFDNGAVVDKTTQTLTNEISVDIVFPGGLFTVNDKGTAIQAQTSFAIEYRPFGSFGAWTNVATLPTTSRTISHFSCQVFGTVFRVTSSARQSLRIGVHWKVPQGQYEVRLSRYGTTWANGSQTSARFDSAQITTLRSIKYTQPSKTGTMKLALRIQATDQLNGVINQLSVQGQQKIKAWNGTGWDAPAPNFNPAWVYYWLLTDCEGVAQKVSEDRIDLQAFIDWAADCEAKGFNTRGMLDRSIAFGDLARMVLASGRASFAMRDGKYSVLYDRDTIVPVQHFTPANSYGFSGQRVFVDMPHALRVKFQNPALNWQEDEIIVLDDDHSFEGKNARGVSSALPEATKFETMSVPFVTEPEAAWRLGRFQIAQGLFRSNTYSWECDVENLICTRGDLVYVAHDVVDWGDGFGLISDVVRNGSGQVTQIVTAEPLTVSGTGHSIRVRARTGNTYISAISGLVAGVETTTFTLVTPMGSDVDTGDLYLIGKTGQDVRKLLITKIEPSSDLRATIQAVEYSDQVQAFDESPPATFTSAISGTLILEPPPPPRLYAVLSNQYVFPPDDGGSTRPVVQIGIGPGSSGYYNTGNRYVNREDSERHVV